MSLVIGIACQDFMLFCGERRVIYSKNQVSEDFIKVFKLSNSLIIGITGTIKGNIDFLNFLFVIENGKFKIRDNIIIPNYLELRAILNERFDDVLNSKTSSTFYTTLGGWDNSQFCLDAYFYNSSDISKSKRTHIEPLNAQDVRFTCMERDNHVHYDNFLMLLEQNKEHTILNYKNIFKSVVDLGSKFDDSINKNCTFESIRRRDVLKS